MAGAAATSAAESHEGAPGKFQRQLQRRPVPRPGAVAGERRMGSIPKWDVLPAWGTS